MNPTYCEEQFLTCYRYKLLIEKQHYLLSKDKSTHFFRDRKRKNKKKIKMHENIRFRAFYFCKSRRNCRRDTTSTFGKEICFKTSKWWSWVTMYLALDIIAQSTNLLSSSSASIKWKAKDGDVINTFFLLRIAETISSEINGEMFLDKTSEYSSMISLVIHKVYLPSRKLCHTW